MTCPVCGERIVDGEAVVVTAISNHFMPGALSKRTTAHERCVDVQARIPLLAHEGAAG
ncbi:MAG: hypothetical protein NUW01_08945 [Gemmatimonadaceae bacterium]|nr:hypothetical protein [Gemmatimonadaceae bacterium]